MVLRRVCASDIDAFDVFLRSVASQSSLMPESELLQWLQSRGFYALLILILLVIGFLLALGRRRKDQPRPRARRPPQFGKPRRGPRR